jgi:hypothetical protein
LNVLENIDEAWRETFRTEWWELELISSVMMDEEVDDLTREDKDKILQALQNMKIMIEKALKSSH